MDYTGAGGMDYNAIGAAEFGAGLRGMGLNAQRRNLSCESPAGAAAVKPAAWRGD